MQPLPASVCAFVLAGALATTLSAARTEPALPHGDAAPAASRPVYVTATDKNGDPVTDLQAADFEVKVGGKLQEIASAQPATVPLRIALLVADQGTGAFQLGLAKFMQALLGKAEFSLVSIKVQPELVVDYSHDGAELSAGLKRLGPRGRERGAQLIEAIQDATGKVQHEGRRPVIVVMRLGGEAASQISGNQVREQLRKSGAALYVISTAGAQGAAPSQARPGISAEQAQLADSELADSSKDLALVLGDGSKDSGGRHDQVVATTYAKTMEQLAQELLHQYEIVYTPSDAVKPGDKLAVASKRKGVTVKAPSRLPD